MANGFNQLHVKSAVKSHNKFDLSRTHLTTMDFGQIVPLFAEETVPGDKFTVNASYFSRMAPLVKPTYGKFSFRTMTVFVPYYQVAEGIDGFMSGSKTWKGSASASRYMDMQVILGLFTSSGNGYINTVTATNVASGAWYDITYIDNAGTQRYYALTSKGKFVMKVLNALGYVWHEGIDLQTGSAYMNSGLYNSNLSALPILAFAKAFNDWMSISQRYNFSTLTSILEDIKNDKTVTISGSSYYASSSHKITWRVLATLFEALRVCYENDYFTSAWQDPNSPVGSGSTYNGMTVPALSDTISNDVISNSFNTGVYSNNTVNINQRSLDFLKAFDDWVRRNNYSGSRAVQQVFSRFGIKTEDFKSNYAHVIDTDIIPIQVGDVTALAQDFVAAGNDNNVELGDYAGKGIMNGNNGFTYQASDYGMLFVFGWYTVSPMMAFGCDRHVLRNDPKDYYNPEFDGLGAEAISVGEVYTNPRIAGVSGDVLDSAVYGYTERYNSYRYGRDKITGEFRKYNLPSTSTYANVGTDQNTWHTGRLLTDVRIAGNLVAQNANMLQLTNTDSEYNRMFSVTSGDVDHFYMTAQFRVTAIRPMLSLNQVPRLGEGDTVLPKNGNEIN